MFDFVDGSSTWKHKKYRALLNDVAKRESTMQATCSGKWGTDAKSLFVGAGDHNLRMFAIADEAVPME